MRSSPQSGQFFTSDKDLLYCLQRICSTNADMLCPKSEYRPERNTVFAKTNHVESIVYSFNMK